MPAVLCVDVWKHQKQLPLLLKPNTFNASLCITMTFRAYVKPSKSPACTTARIWSAAKLRKDLFPGSMKLPEAFHSFSAISSFLHFSQQTHQSVSILCSMKQSAGCTISVAFFRKHFIFIYTGDSASSSCEVGLCPLSFQQ